MSLWVRDELWHRFSWYGRIYFHDEGYAAYAANGCHVLQKLIIEIVVERSVDGVRHFGEQQRVAIWRRANDCSGSNTSIGAQPVLDNELLAQTVR